MITEEKFGNVLVLILLAVIIIIVIPASIAVSELIVRSIMGVVA